MLDDDPYDGYGCRLGLLYIVLSWIICAGIILGAAYYLL